MASSLIDQIAELMLREGELKGQAAREQIAMDEEKRQAKHRVLRNTLKTLAGFAPLFIPGAPLAGVLGEKWANLGASPFEKYLMALNTTAGTESLLKPLAGRVPSGLGYTRFFGPIGKDDWYQTPWDEEGIG